VIVTQMCMLSMRYAKLACHMLGCGFLAEGKDAAVRMFWDGRIKAFHTDRYEAGHRATDYKRWLTATRPYNIV
jgi:hypothetical protein